MTRSRLSSPSIAILCLFLLAVTAWLYSRMPWEWGLMDDSTNVIELGALVEQLGVIRGAWKFFWDSLVHEVTISGFVRYARIAYLSIVYLFPPGIGYAFRYVIGIGILCISTSFLFHFLPESIRSEPRGKLISSLICLLPIFAIRALYDGLFILSSSEFFVVFFSVLGLWLHVRGASRYAVFAVFLVALGFKAPFLWFVMGYGFFLYFMEKRRAFGIFCAVFSVAFLGLSIVLQRHGVYSSHVYKFELANFLSTLRHIALHSAFPVAALAAAVAFCFPLRRAERGFLQLNRAYSLWLLFASAGYLAILVPRGVGKGLGYYLAPGLFFFVLAVLTWLLPSFRSGSYRRQELARPASLLLAFAVAIGIGAYALRGGFARDASVRGFRDWALQQPSQGLTFATNSEEVVTRLRDMMAMRTDGRWKNEFVPLMAIEGFTSAAATADYYVVFHDQAPPYPQAMRNPALHLPSATIYDLKQKTPGHSTSSPF